MSERKRTLCKSAGMIFSLPKGHFKIRGWVFTRFRGWVLEKSIWNFEKYFENGVVITGKKVQLL